jgi:hypothetical protein
MSFRVSWRHDDGDGGTDVFDSDNAALAAAKRVGGIALVHREPSGSVSVFRDGTELDGADATQAFEEFMSAPVVEILRTRAEEADYNIDPEDQTGSGWREGKPEGYGWRIARHQGSGPEARSVVLRGPEGTFPTPQAAEEEARKALEADYEFGKLPIVHIYK